MDRLDLDDDYDFDEPMMPGNEDEFSDCDLEDEDDNNVSVGEQTTSPSSTQLAAPALPTD